MEDCDALFAEFGIANGDKEVVLHLLEDLEPALSLVAVLELARIATADVQDLHMVGLERLVLRLDNHINECVGEEDLIEVREIALKLIVEREIA